MQQYKYFFLVVFCITLYFVFYLYKPFIMNIIIASLLCVSTFSLKTTIDKYIKYELISSFIALVIFLSCFLAPLVLVSFNLINELSKVDLVLLTSFINDIKEIIIVYFRDIHPSIGNIIIDNIKSLDIGIITSKLVNISAMTLKFSIDFFINLFFVIIFLYLFYYYGTYLRDYVIDIIPFDKNYSVDILFEVSSVLKIVFLTTIISMVLQGISFGLAAMYFGFSPLLFSVLYAIASIIPIIGGALVWVPFALYLYWQNDVKGAIFIIFYSMIFIGFIIDNLIKPIIINAINKFILAKSVQINEMIIFMSILAGLSSFGFFGIIIGPTIVALFLSLLRIYRLKLKHK